MSQHKSNRMQGYLLFYLDTKNIRRAPFYAVSIGNFVLLLVDVILNDYCYAYRCLWPLIQLFILFAFLSHT